MKFKLRKKQVEEMGKKIVCLVLSLLMIFQLIDYSGITFYAAENTSTAVEPDTDTEISNSSSETEDENNGIVNEEVSYEDFTISENYTLNADMDVNNLTIKGGTFNLNGYQLNVHEDLNVSGGILNINKGYINCLGNAVFSGYNSLIMQNINDYIFVKGDFIWNQGYQTQITNGIIEIQGDFIDNYKSNYYCFGSSGNNKVLLSGNQKQNIVQSSVYSFINILEIKNTSDEGICASSPIIAGEIIRNGSNLSYPVSGKFGWTLQEDEEINGDVCLIGDNLNLNGHTLTIHGNLIQYSGKVVMNGGILKIDKDYKIQSCTYNENNEMVYAYSSGYLEMTGPEDTVIINGDFITASANSHDGKLTAGTMYIGGDFTQIVTASNLNFAATGTHKVVFNGEDAQSITFENAYYNTSHFAGLEFANSSEAGITVTDRGVVISELTNESSNVTGYVDLHTGAAVTNNSYKGSLRFVTDYTLNGDLTITGDMYASNVVNLNGNTFEVGGNSTVYNTCININGGQFICEGNLNIDSGWNYSGYLNMTKESDYVIVYGDFVYSSRIGNSSQMKAGTLELKGNFQQLVTRYEDNFQATGTHKVIFSGDKKQRISFASAKSYFNIVEIQNQSSDGVVIDKNFNCSRLVRNNCRVSLSDGGVLGWTLEEDTVIDGDLYIGADQLNLNGYSLTIKGNLIQGGGFVCLNGGNLTVNGDYRIQSMTTEDNGTITYAGSTGYLEMTGPEDTVIINGDFITASANSHDGKLTAGTMYIGGDFTQIVTASNLNFAATGTHKVVFNGEDAQSITFENAYYNTSHFAGLEFANSSEAGITVTDRGVVISELTNESSNVTGYVDLHTGAAVTNNSYKGSLRFVTDYTLNGDLTITGDMYASNVVNLNGNTFEVGGNSTVYNTCININGGQFICEGNLNIDSGWNYSGYLNMTKESDYVIVYGDFVYSSRIGNSSQMKAGTLELKGNFQQLVTRYEDNFQATGTHKVIFSGDKKQRIFFASAKSYFNIVEIRNYSNDGIYCENGLNALEIITNNCNISYDGSEVLGWTLNSDTVIGEDLVMIGDTLDLNGYTLTVNGDFIQNSGTVYINGGTLIVDGDYRLQSASYQNNDAVSYDYSRGILKMISGDDYVRVNGDFVTSSTQSHANMLTAGVLELHGNFIQNNTSVNDNFICSDNFVLKFAGNSQQTVYFSSPVNSKVSNVIFDNASSQGVNISNSMYVTKAVEDNSRNVMGNIFVSSLYALKNNYFSGSVTLNSALTLTSDITLGGTLTLASQLSLNGFTLIADSIIIQSGTLDMNGGMINCNKNFTIERYGILIMDNEADHIVTGGDFITNTIYSHSGKLSNGILEIKGDFIQNGTNEAFVCTDNHSVILSGKSGTSGRVYKQTITFSSVGVSAFYQLTLTKPVEYYSFNTDIKNICSELIEDIKDMEAPSKVEGLTITDTTATTVSMTWNPSEDNIKVLGYEIYRNNEKIATVTKTEFADSKLEPEKSYIYKVCAFDEMRNVSEFSAPVSVTTAADTIAPEIPQSLKVSCRTGSSITINWLPSSDNVGCTGYKIFRNDEAIAVVNNETSYKDHGVSIGTEYIYKIKAIDGAGNESGFSNSISGYAINPSITKILPAAYTVIGDGVVTLTVRFVNTGNSIGNRVKFQYSEDGETWRDISRNLIGQQNYSGTELYASCNWNISGLDSGEYTVKCTLYDADDNYVEKEITYIIDNDPPEKVNHVDAGTENGAVIIWWDVASDADCVSYNLYKSEDNTFDFKKIKSITNVNTVSYMDKSIVEGQTYHYYVTALDKFGHESEKSNIVSIVAAADEEKPYIVSIANSSKINGESEIKVTAYDNISVSHILLQYYNSDKEEWSDIGTENAVNGVSSIKWNTTTLQDGVYSVRAFAWDTSGNKSAEAFTASLEIDNTGPDKIIISEVTATSSGVSIKWQDIKDEDFSYFQVEKWVDGKFVAIGTESQILGMNVTGLIPNTMYKFRVVGYDILGNRGEISDEIEITTTFDDVKPYITGFSPSQSAFRNNIDFKVTAKDNYAVASLQIYYSEDKENWTLLTTLTNEMASGENTFEYDCSLEEFSEGIMYFKAVVLDSAGNESIPIVTSHKVDRTPPLAIVNLKAEDKNGYVSLNWTALNDDIKYFIIYRADEETGIYTELEHECTTKNYYDENVEYGKIYSYKIKAVDLAGNISDESNETIVQVSEDTEAPVIYGMTPEAGSTVGSNPSISAVAYDAKLKSLYIEYRKVDSDNLWTELGKKDSINGSYEKVDFEWNTNGLDEGTYLIRAVAIDYNNNTSVPYEITYTLDTTAPKRPVLTLLQDNYQIHLEWDKVDCEDFSHFIIYRKSVLENQYSVIKKTSDCNYTDTEVKEGLVYEYKIEAYDLYGNCSESNIMLGYAYDVDTISPVAAAPEEMIVVAGHQFVLDGTESTDNVRIKSFSWYMGNGETVYGSKTYYTYENAGKYTVVLTVTDAAGNSDTTRINVTVLDKDTSAGKRIQVVNENHEPISYAYVYLYSENNGNRTLKTDSEGMVTVSGNFGEQKIAVYKQGYQPKEHIVQIDSVGNGEIETVTLKAGEVVVGDFSVHRMELEEMVEAGIDFTNPENYESFTFTVELTFRETSIPTIIRYIYTSGGTTLIGGGGIGGIEGGGGSAFRYNGGSIQIERIEIIGEEDLPLFAYINKTDSISWLKEMFCAELGIINCADAAFSLTNCSASIRIPEGLSLAKTYNGQSTVQDMGTIDGQTSKSVSWYIKGDKAGEYNLTADFSGILMPFHVPLNVSFETKEPFKVESGNGINIYIYPEDAAYIGKEYYIQYEVRNESNRIFYNFETTFGTYTSPGYEEEITITDTNGNVNKQVYKGETYVIPEASSCNSVPIVSGGDTLSVGVFAPGESIYGTYKVLFSAPSTTGDSYYRLIESVAEELGESNTGVKLHISSIPSHITKYNVVCKEVKNLWGDPVNMTTGAFTDSISAMTLNCNPVLSFDLSYDSLHSAYGECGYGWSHNFESRLVNEKGIVNLYLTPENFISFVAEDKIIRNINGEVIDKQIMLNTADKDEGAKNFICISTGMADYRLYRDENGSYTLNLPDGQIWQFNPDGKLTKLIESTGKYVNITYGLNSMTITEPLSGMNFTAHYNDAGLLTSVEDYTGRRTLFAYENGCLIRATNPLGESIYYLYDENHRLVQEQNNDKVTFVTNTYDEQGRVIEQDDADSETPLTFYEYKVDEDGNTDTTATDRNGNQVIYHSDGLGHISKITDQNGNTISYAYDKDGNKISETNAVGGTTLYFYNEQGNIEKIRDCQGNITGMEYDEEGNLTKLTGANGETSIYTYDIKNQLLTSTENSGIRKSYTYDEYGNILTEATSGLGVIYYTYTNGFQTGITDYNGNIVKTIYDDYGNVKQLIAADGSTTTYTYDALGRKTGITDSNGGTVSYTYDCNSNVTSITDENGGIATFKYNSNNWLVEATNKRNGTTVYEYDAEGRNIKTTNPDGSIVTTIYDGVGCALSTTDEEGNIYTYEYDAANRLVSKILPNGSKTSYEYYPNGKEKKITYADGSSISYTYDKAWRLIKTEDNLGRIYEYEYDNAGNLVKTMDPLGNVTTSEYDIYGHMLSATDGNGNTTSYEYDAKGNCIKKTNALGFVMEMTYDSQNRMTSLTAKTEYGDYTIGYKYDVLGRVSEYTDEEGNIFKTEYDNLGNITAVIDADGQVTTKTEYDSAGNISKITDALDISGIYDYNARGNLIQKTENAGTNMEEVWTYAYDALGRLIQVVDAENGESSYTYDEVGNITSISDPNGGTSIYRYDSMSRLTESINAVGSKHTYMYNAAGLLMEAKNARNQSTTYEYDDLGRIISATDELGTISYTYDANGNVLTITDNEGTITREYDALNRVTKYTDARGNTVKYGYDTLGNLITLTYPGGEIIRYAYYPTGRLKTVTDWKNRVINFEYDGNGRLIKLSRPDGSVETYEYDAAGQLIKQTDINGDKVVNSYTYTYDTAGNIVGIQSKNVAKEKTNISSVTMEYDAANRLIKYDNQTVKYDADGNMIYGPLNGEMETFTYDCRNRLLSAGSTSYEYDAENNRIAVDNGTTRTEYVVENNSGSLSQILTATQNEKTTLFVYGDGLLAQENEAEGYLLYHFNNIGSTSALTDADGKIVHAYTYGTYGELLSGDSDGIMFLYNGRYGVVNDENGLYYMRARYYNTDIKRFINQDVVEGNITNSTSLNKYAYCQGNPVKLTDPFGLSPSINWSSLGHALLDVAGFIPVIGAVADTINGIWYLCEGDYFSATACFISAIPGLGDIAGAAVKAFTGCTKYTKIIKYASRLIGNVGNMALGAYQTADIVVSLYDKHAVNGEAWDLDSTFRLFGAAMFTTSTVMSAKGMVNDLVNYEGIKLNIQTSQCFVEGTLVLTEEGDKPIEEIQAGDFVYSTNPETGESGYKEVLRTFRKESDVIIHIFVNDEEIETTVVHPFWVENQWVSAKDLEAGDVLTLSDGSTAVISKVYGEKLENPVIVYNFEVEDYHTYYVTDMGVLVHNAHCTVTGSESGSNTNRNNRLALGLRDYLDDFATNNNAHTWKDFPDPNNWKDGVNDALFNPDMEILVNLDGIDNPMLAMQRAASNRGGATDWELLQIKLTPSAWDRVTWFLNGEVVSNPFN